MRRERRELPIQSGFPRRSLRDLCVAAFRKSHERRATRNCPRGRRARFFGGLRTRGWWRCEVLGELPGMARTTAGSSARKQPYNVFALIVRGGGIRHCRRSRYTRCQGFSPFAKNPTIASFTAPQSRCAAPDLASSGSTCPAMVTLTNVQIVCDNAIDAVRKGSLILAKGSIVPLLGANGRQVRDAESHLRLD